MHIKLLLLLISQLYLFAQIQTINIGVLAKRGNEFAIKKWQPTANYLEKRIEGYKFNIIPLNFEQIDLAVRKNQIDFLIINSAFYVQLEQKYNISRIATLLNKSSDNNYVSYFGGVIFTKSDSNINSIKDLKNRSFAAVDPNSFGGWIMAFKLFYDKGIKPSKYFSKLDFLGTHDNVVEAVLKDKVDAGCVRSDTLERMQLEGKININDFYIINRVQGETFPFVLSTPLYPEWPIAKIRKTSNEIAKKVALQLMVMPSNSIAATTAGIGGWTIPANYSSVTKSLEVLQIGPYKHSINEHLYEFIKEYLFFISFVFVTIIFIFFLLFYVFRLNFSLKRSKIELANSNKDLEKKVKKRTASIEEFLNKEKFLRVIMSTISDINRYLITYKQINELLKKSTQRLVKPKEYTISFVYLEGDFYKNRWHYSSKIDGSEKLEEFLKKEFETKKGIASYFLEKKDNEIINDIRTYDLDEVFRKLCLDLNIYSCTFFALKPNVQKPFYNGILGILKKEGKGFELEEIRMLEELSGDLGFAIEANMDSMEKERLKNEQIQNYEETIISFVKMIEQRDTYTAGHTTRVAKYSQLIAQKMDLDSGDIHKLVKASILHDIGKISTPDAVLLKPGTLNELEYKMIKEHVSVGYEMLKGIKIYADLAEIMLHHHERYDGSGYPSGLKKDEIPLLSAIMSVADTFDAMTSTRIYKKSKSVKEALAELDSLKGTQFNPKVVDVAINVLKEVNVSSTINQTPTNEIERERLAYFYKDYLTGFYNETYLKLMINQKEFINEFSSIYEIKSNNAVETELSQGIKKVEKVLSNFAEELTDKADVIFFIKPSSFYLFSKENIDEKIDKFMKNLDNQGLEFKFRTLTIEELKKYILKEE